MRITAGILCLGVTLAVATACGPEAPPRGDGERAERATAETAAGEANRAAAGPAGPAAADDSSRILHGRLMAWQGGQEAWDDTRFLRFRWLVEREGETVADRAHAWDRRDGRYRLAYQDGEGRRIRAVFDVESLREESLPDSGTVRVDGRALEGAARDSALRSAYAAFINDSYWLLMPLKWGDPGVHLAYEGMTTLPDGRDYATVHLTFEAGLGVTNDQYWAYVVPDSGRLVAWRYHLQNREEPGDLIWWEDWRSFGPQELRLAMNRRWEGGEGGGTRIHFEGVTADTVAPDSVFVDHGG